MTTAYRVRVLRWFLFGLVCLVIGSGALFYGAQKRRHPPEYETLLAQFRQYEVFCETVLLNRNMQVSAVPTDQLVQQTSQEWRTTAMLIAPLLGVLLLVMVCMQAWYLHKYTRMQNALQQSEASVRRERDVLARFTDVSPVGITVVNRDGHITFANIRAEQILGLSKDDITQRTYNAPEWHITDYEGHPFPDDQLPFVQVMQTGAPVFDVRHAIVWPDGQRVLLSINAAPLRDEHGEVDGMVATVEDVTEKVLTEEKIRKAREQLQSIFRAAPIGVGVIQNRIFTFVNQQLFDLLGYAEAELLGKSVRILYPTQEEYERVGRVKYAQIEKEGIGTVETLFQRKDGTILEVLLSSSPIDPGNLDVGVTFTVLDITERKRMDRALVEYRERLEDLVEKRTAELLHRNVQLQQEIAERNRAEATLRKSEIFLNSIIEQSPYAMWISDECGTLIRLNQACRDLLNITDEEVVGRYNVLCDNIVREQRFLPLVQAVFEKGETARFEIVYDSAALEQLKLQHTKFVILNATIFPIKDAEGNVTNAVIQHLNITERRQAEEELQRHREHLEELVEERTAELRKTNEQLRQEVRDRQQAERQLQRYAAELKEANIELSQYAYVVSHDLQTPLRAIRNYADFLREDLEDMLEEEQQEYLDGLQRAVQEATALIQDILELSRVGQRMGDIETLDTGTFTRQILSSIAESEEIDLVMPEHWPMLETWPVLLRQIFQNLLTNAVKFNHSSPKRIELGWQKTNDAEYEFFVRDNGIGIEAEHLTKIFRVFERLHSNQEFTGTGIGLAIVKKAVSKLGGTIRVESQPGRGTTFFITVPEYVKSCTE